MNSLRGMCAMLCLCVVSGCANYERQPLTSAEDEARQTYPAEYRSELIAFLKTYLNNPEQVRSAQIAQPEKRSYRGRTLYVVCLRYNARDSGGAYTGVSDRFAVFAEGRFSSLVEKEPARDMCDRASYQPFPEMERMKRS